MYSCVLTLDNGMPSFISFKSVVVADSIRALSGVSMLFESGAFHFIGIVNGMVLPIPAWLNSTFI